VASFSVLLIGSPQNILSFIFPRSYRKNLYLFGKNFSGSYTVVRERAATLSQTLGTPMP
jgi:hypothetical protein